MGKIAYKINERIHLDQIIQLFYHSDYLPIDNMQDKHRLELMFENANLIVSAWDGERLVGISRSLCDFSYCCYLSDICVDIEYRNINVGKRLIELTKERAGKECKLILHSSINSLKFYQQFSLSVR